MTAAALGLLVAALALCALQLGRIADGLWQIAEQIMLSRHRTGGQGAMNAREQRNEVTP